MHCVAGTHGARITEELNSDGVKVFRKGYNVDLDSYSAFADSFDYETTGLHDHLQKNAVEDVFVVGLAEDVSISFVEGHY